MVLLHFKSISGNWFIEWKHRVPSLILFLNTRAANVEAGTLKCIVLILLTVGIKKKQHKDFCFVIYIVSSVFRPKEWHSGAKTPNKHMNLQHKVVFTKHWVHLYLAWNYNWLFTHFWQNPRGADATRLQSVIFCSILPCFSDRIHCDF